MTNRRTGIPPGRSRMWRLAATSAALTAAVWPATTGVDATATSSTLRAPSPRATDTGYPSVVQAFGRTDPHGLIHDRLAIDDITLGTDTVAVVRCEAPPDSTDPFLANLLGRGTFDASPTSVVKWLERHVAPWFEEVSRGRLTMRFRAAGTIRLSRTAPAISCLAEAYGRTEPGDTNVLVYDNTFYTGGSARRGFFRCGVICRYDADDGLPPSGSGRGAYVGGGAIGDPDWPNHHTVIHELGHTMGWQHSHRDDNDEYDNPWDVMSFKLLCPGDTFDCIENAQHTLAVNRYAAGWIDPDEVLVLSRRRPRTVTVELSAPTRPGTQMVAVRIGRNRFISIEARPNVGRDSVLPFGGVAVHRVKVPRCRVVAATCPGGRISPAGRGWNAQSVRVGDSLTTSRVRVEVTTETEHGYRVTISVN